MSSVPNILLDTSCGPVIDDLAGMMYLCHIIMLRSNPKRMGSLHTRKILGHLTLGSAGITTTRKFPKPIFLGKRWRGYAKEVSWVTSSAPHRSGASHS